MPPRMKVLRAHKCGESCGDKCKKNPRVILRPFMADFSGQNRRCFKTLPSTASLFNKPESSDIKLNVGGDFYYAHRLILSAASDVFSRMLGSDWKEGTSAELVLEEEEECVKVFDRFLYFIYTGTIVLSEYYVIPLYILADKYNVNSLHEECVKVIKNGLKVFLTSKSGSPLTITDTTLSLEAAGPSSSSFHLSGSGTSSNTDSSDYSESEHSPSPPPDLSPHNSLPSSPSKPTPIKTVLVASEVFPLAVITRMLSFCSNENIINAALYNLEARLGNQISQGNFSVWKDLPEDLIVRMLSDNYFYCDEYHLFQAARAWLTSNDPSLATQIFQHIRFSILSPCELYKVHRDPLVRAQPDISCAVQEAIRFQLFKGCCSNDDLQQWQGPAYQPRQTRPN